MNPNQISLWEQQDFLPIENLNHLRPFAIRMLTLGQILLKNCNSVRELRAERISKLLFKHQLGYFRPQELREEAGTYRDDIRGGGVKVEIVDLSHLPYRTYHHYEFSFYRLFRPEELMVVQGKPVQSSIRLDAVQVANSSIDAKQIGDQSS